jgi:hypothetical protein
MTGTDLAVRLRGAEATRGIVLVALSGRLEPSVAVVRLFDAFLSKPADPARLVELVETLCGEPRSQVRRVEPQPAPATSRAG